LLIDQIFEQDTNLDVAFFNDSDALREQFGRAGLRFDVPQPSEADLQAPSAPGRDPSSPPKLR